jgi:hypothetical protein
LKDDEFISRRKYYYKGNRILEKDIDVERGANLPKV